MSESDISYSSNSNHYERDIDILFDSDTDIDKFIKDMTSLHIPIQCNKFNFNCLSFSDLIVNYERDKLIMHCTSIYHNSNKYVNFTFETKWIKLSQYGIPLNGPDPYYLDDKNRQFIKIPFDPNQQSCIELKNMLEKIDNKLINNLPLENFARLKRTTNDKINKLFEYLPIVRSLDNPRQFSDTVDKYVNEHQTHSYSKFKFLKTYDDKIGTRFNSVLSDGVLEPLEVNCISDLDDILALNSEVKMLVCMNFLANKVRNPYRDNMREAECEFLVVRMDIKSCTYKSDTDEILNDKTDKYDFNIEI